MNPDPHVLANELSVARAELARLTVDRDEALTIADRHRLTCQGVEEDFHALEESNERLRSALSTCVAALTLAHGFVQEELNVRVKSHTMHGDTATLDEGGITICGEATDCLATIEIGRDAGRAALTKES